MSMWTDLFNKGGTLFGQSHDYWLDKLGVDDKQLENMISSLSRNVGTTQREGMNRAGELAAGADLPVAAQLALERGANQSANQAMVEGTAGIEQYGSEANRQAWSQILSGESSEAQIDMQREMAEDDFWGDLIGGVATVIPFL